MGQRFGSHTMACSVNELFKYTPKEEKPGKAVDVLSDVSKEIAKKNAAGVVLSTLFGLGFTGAAATTLAQGLGAVVIASIPGINKDYHAKSTQAVQSFVNKLFKKLRTLKNKRFK